MSNTIYNKITINNDTLIDLSQDTVTSAAHIVSGYVGHLADGTQVTGTGGEATLQSKTVSPTESSQTVTPDSGYDGLSSVSVNAISSSYVGTGVTRRSSSDLTASDATVTAPAGYYAEAATKTVASGTAGTPTATKGTVSNHSVSVTPSVTNTTGYISGSTKTGTAVTVSASELASGNKAISANGTGIDVVGYSTVSVNVASESEDFIVNIGSSAGIYEAEYEPDKAFSEIQAAYNSGKNIVVTSDELPVFGWYDHEQSILTIEFYDGNTGYDIAYALSSQGYQEIGRLKVCETGDATATANDILAGKLAYGANGAINGAIPLRTSSNINISGQTVTVTNGYYASDTSVNVPSSGGMNFQTVTDGNRVNTTSYSAVSGQSIKVAVSGKYTVSWTGFRSSTGGTNGSQLYIDGTAHGNANTTFSNNIQINELTNITLNKNQVVTVRARARGTSYYMYVSNLTIQQTA